MQHKLYAKLHANALMKSMQVGSTHLLLFHYPFLFNLRFLYLSHITRLDLESIIGKSTVVILASSRECSYTVRTFGNTLSDREERPTRFLIYTP